MPSLPLQHSTEKKSTERLIKQNLMPSCIQSGFVRGWRCPLVDAGIAKPLANRFSQKPVTPVWFGFVGVLKTDQFKLNNLKFCNKKLYKKLHHL
jgi:hypothetical protein